MAVLYPILLLMPQIQSFSRPSLLGPPFRSFLVQERDKVDQQKIQGLDYYLIQCAFLWLLILQFIHDSDLLTTSWLHAEHHPTSYIVLTPATDCLMRRGFCTTVFHCACITFLLSDIVSFYVLKIVLENWHFRVLMIAAPCRRMDLAFHCFRQEVWYDFIPLNE